MINSNLLISMERSVLSSILYNCTILDNITSSMLEYSDFYLEGHQHIYKIMSDLHNEQQPIDELIVEKRMDFKKADQTMLIEILSANPTPNVYEYIKDIRDSANRRKLDSLTHTIRKELKDGETSTTDIISILDEEKENILNKSISIISKTSLIKCEEADAQFYCRDWLPIPRGTISMIAAPGGTGKTWIVLQLALRFLIENPNKKVFLWLSEDRPSLIKNRAKQICSSILKEDINKFDRLEIATSQPIQLLVKDKGNFKISGKINQIKQELKDYDLIVFDPLLAFYGGDENDNSQARIFMQPFMNWASSSNNSIVFLHHSSKSNAQNSVNRTRGAGALVDACRAVYEMNKIYKQDNQTLQSNQLHLRDIKLSKDNYGAIRFLKDFKVTRQITPFDSAATVEITQYKMDGEV